MAIVACKLKASRQKLVLRKSWVKQTLWNRNRTEKQNPGKIGGKPQNKKASKPMTAKRWLAKGKSVWSGGLWWGANKQQQKQGQRKSKRGAGEQESRGAGGRQLNQIQTHRWKTNKNRSTYNNKKTGKPRNILLAIYGWHKPEPALRKISVCYVSQSLYFLALKITLSTIVRSNY